MPLSPAAGASQNRAMKMAWASVTVEAASRIVAAAKYSGIAAARPRTMASTTKRTDSRWSPNSLEPMTIQPARGTDRPRAAVVALVGAAGAGAGSDRAVMPPPPGRAPVERPRGDRCPRATGRPRGWRSGAGPARRRWRRSRVRTSAARAASPTVTVHGWDGVAPAVTAVTPSMPASRSWMPVGAGVVGRLEADLEVAGAVAEARRQVGHRALADEPAGGEDADAVAHRLDLVEQVAGQQDGQAALAHEAPAAGRGSRRRRAGRWPWSARRG